MALLNVNFFSYTLGMDTTMMVLLPEKRQKKPEPSLNKKYPVLYLLHGHSDDQTSWIRKSLIELLVRDKDLIVVMPTTHRGFYSNCKHGHNYFDFFTEELPIIVGNFFPASDKREDTYIAGISMGGYGAFKIALSCPDRYAAAASLSGGLYPLETIAMTQKNQMFSVSDFSDNFTNIFGSEKEYKKSANDLEYLALQASKEKNKPRLWMCVGQEDPLYISNQKYRNYMEKLQTFDFTYKENAGTHDWHFWNSEIPEMLTFFGFN